MREKEGFEQLLLPFAINDLVNSKLGQNISNNMICNLFNCLQNFFFELTHLFCKFVNLIAWLVSTKYIV